LLPKCREGRNFKTWRWRSADFSRISGSLRVFLGSQLNMPLKASYL
jgi:hypothetical protein